MTTWGCGSVFKHLTTGGGLPPLTIANGFPSVPTSLYCTMCTVRCVQYVQSKRTPTILCCYRLSCRWLSRQLVHVHTSVARLNLVIARSVPTSLHCYWFPIVGTTFVHLESVHTWVARLNLVNDQGLDYRLKGIFDLKSISGYQHPNMRSILHLLNLWQLANREYWYSRKINCQYSLHTCLHWPHSTIFYLWNQNR